MALSLTIFGFDFFKVHWWHVLYVILALAVIGMGTQRLLPSGIGRAVIFAVGAVLVFYFFDQRWFGVQAALPRTWPPTVNMCPDYLTFIPNVSESSSASGGVCVDLLGVTSSSAGIQKTKQSELSSLSAADTNKVFEYTAEDVKAAKSADDLQLICTRCNIAGVTWEGVWDGDTCKGAAQAEAAAKAADQCTIDISKDLQRIENSFYG